MTTDVINGVPRELIQRADERLAIVWGPTDPLRRELSALLATAKPAADGERELIREVFLRNGFSIKDGHDDLKPYVYAAGFDLLEKARAAQPQQAVAVTDEVPAQCRQRLAAEGKPYPRSSCQVCGQLSPKWRECDAALSAHKTGEEE